MHLGQFMFLPLPICSVYYSMKRTVDLRKEVFIKHRSSELTQNIPTDYLTEVEKC